MKPWPSRILPLNTGWDDGSANNTPVPQIISALNVEFSRRGSVRPRPSASLQTGCIFQTATATGQMILVSNTPANLATVTTQWARVAMATVKDAQSEQPAAILRGRTLVYDGSLWADRLGAAPAKVVRGATYRHGINAGLAALTPPADSTESNVTVIAPDFGFDNTATGKGLKLRDGAGSVSLSAATTYAKGPGTTARCGSITAAIRTVYTSGGTGALGVADLVLLTRSANSLLVTETRLAVDAFPSTGRGANPVICCDLNATNFFIVYMQSITFDLICLRVSTAAAILTTTTLVAGLGTYPPFNGLWLTNSTVAADKLTVAYTGDPAAAATPGLRTTVRSMTTLATAGIDITDTGVYGAGPVVCGAWDGGFVWTAWVGNDGALRISKRSTTAAATHSMYTYTGRYRPGAAANTDYLPAWFIQHQPILFDGHVLMGVCQEPDIPATLTGFYGQSGCTWTVLDLTDLYDSTLPSVYKRLTPGLVARGPSEGSGEAWNPFSAVIAADGTYYEFGSLDWTQFAGSVDGQVSTLPTLGTLAMNRVSWMAPQVTHYNSTTIIGGSVPHGIARADSHELGWVENRPVIVAVNGGTPGALSGSYTVRTVWRWVDAAGQVHRSEPSLARTLTPASGRIDVTSSCPQITEKPFSDIQVEFYLTDANPTDESALYLQASIKVQDTGVPVTSITQGFIRVITSAEVLYTQANQLENQFVGGSGGCVSIGERCWMSDGIAVYASKIGNPGEPPQWHADGPLTLDIPPAAGQIVGLSYMEEKLLIFCERGIFVSTGNGPDNFGAGQDFLVPVKVSEVGLKYPRAVASTPAGIFFGAARPTSAGAGVYYGGVFVLNSNLTVSYASQRIQDTMTTDVTDILFVPSRDLLLFQESATWILDLRANQVSKWAFGVAEMGTSLTWASAVGAGEIWALGLEPMRFGVQSGLGFDVGAATTAYAGGMALVADSVAPGDDELSWGRVRSLKLLGNNPTPGTHTLDIAALLDDSIALSMTQITLPDASSTTWPTNRYAPEWRLPQQKCSSLRITLTAQALTSGSLPEWTGLEVQYRPITRAPSRTRN